MRSRIEQAHDVLGIEMQERRHAASVPSVLTLRWPPGTRVNRRNRGMVMRKLVVVLSAALGVGALVVLASPAGAKSDNGVRIVNLNLLHGLGADLSCTKK
jgi:hypothetical protein